MNFFRHSAPLLIPLFLVGILSLILFNLGVNDRITLAVSHGGTGLVLAGVLIYIVFFHSRKRWPKLSWRERHERLVSVLWR